MELTSSPKTKSKTKLPKRSGLFMNCAAIIAKNFHFSTEKTKKFLAAKIFHAPSMPSICRKKELVNGYNDITARHPEKERTFHAKVSLIVSVVKIVIAS